MHELQILFLTFLHGFVIGQAVSYLKDNAVFNLQIVGLGGVKIDYKAICWLIFGFATAISLICTFL